MRFALFHVLQAGARAERRAIAAKGLTGPGYDGHAFWDTETFVLPVLTYTTPHAAADALRWRRDTLELARARAGQLGLSGAAFPWRTIHGEECCGYWPAGTAAFHVNADIADAVVRYQAAADDDSEFERDVGLELLVETARLWRSLGHHDAAGRFRIDGVTGPDEYSAIADNNVYTNLMAQRNLRAAADAVERHPERAAELGVDDEETASWRDAAQAMLVPYDERPRRPPPGGGLHPASGLGLRAHGARAISAAAALPLLRPLPQAGRQAGRLVLALHLRGDAFSDEEKARNFAYYERLTVRDSSLSACTQAVIAAEVGHLELAYDYLAEAALIDLDDLEHNTRDGLHIASLAGTWIAAVAGFGGMRDHDGVLSFAPRLPQALTRIAFRLCFSRAKAARRGRTRAGHLLAARRRAARDRPPRPSARRSSAQRPLTRSIPAQRPREAPSQPAGRAPEHRRSTRRRRLLVTPFPGLEQRRRTVTARPGPRWPSALRSRGSGRRSAGRRRCR